MSIQGLNNIDSIKQLNTPTFVSSYRKKYIEGQPKTCLGKIKALCALVWLKTLGSNGWRAGEGIVGVGSIAEERTCVNNYQSALTDLISHLTKNPWADKTDAELLNIRAKPSNDKEIGAKNDLTTKTNAFYAALKERVVQLTGPVGADASKIEEQAALYQAGFEEVSAKIEAHNQAQTNAYVFKKSQIANGADLVVKSRIAIEARKDLAGQITPEDIIKYGPKVLADAVDLYIRTFDRTEPKTDLVASVRKEIIDKHSEKFLELADDINSAQHFQNCVRDRRIPLLSAQRQAHEKLTRLENQAADLVNKMADQHARLESPKAEKEQLWEQLDQYQNDEAMINYIGRFAQPANGDDLSEPEAYMAVCKATEALEANQFGNKVLSEEELTLLPKLKALKSILDRLVVLVPTLSRKNALKDIIPLTKKRCEEIFIEIDSVKSKIKEIDDALQYLESDLNVEIYDQTQSLSYFTNTRSISETDFFSLIYPDQGMPAPEELCELSDCLRVSGAIMENHIESALVDDAQPSDFAYSVDTSATEPRASSKISSLHTVSISEAFEGVSFARSPTPNTLVQVLKPDPFSDLSLEFVQKQKLFAQHKYVKPPAPIKSEPESPIKITILPGEGESAAS